MRFRDSEREAGTASRGAAELFGTWEAHVRDLRRGGGGRERGRRREVREGEEGRRRRNAAVAGGVTRAEWIC